MEPFARDESGGRRLRIESARAWGFLSRLPRRDPPISVIHGERRLWTLIATILPLLTRDSCPKLSGFVSPGQSWSVLVSALQASAGALESSRLRRIDSAFYCIHTFTVHHLDISHDHQDLLEIADVHKESRTGLPVVMTSVTLTNPLFAPHLHDNPRLSPSRSGTSDIHNSFWSLS